MAPKYKKLWEFLEKEYGFKCYFHGSEHLHICLEKDDEYYYAPITDELDDRDLFEVTLVALSFYLRHKVGLMK